MIKNISYIIVLLVGVILGYYLNNNYVFLGNENNSSFAKKIYTNSIINGINFNGLLKSKDSQKIVLVNDSDEIVIFIGANTSLIDTHANNKVGSYNNGNPNLKEGARITGTASFKTVEGISNQLLADTIIIN